MTNSQNLSPQPLFLDAETGHPEIAETIAHNINMLAGIGGVVSNREAAAKTIEGCRCAAVPMVLYVDSATGRIEGVGSYEQIKRVKHRLSSTDELTSAEEELATGLPRELLDNPNTSRINMWYETAAGLEAIDESDVRVLRPASWPRNDRIRLSGKYLTRHPLERLIPSPIERDTFLRSIDDYNNMPEPDVLTVAGQELDGEDPIVAHNLSLLSSSAMQHVMSIESAAGDTDYVTIQGRNYPCRSVNGYADRRTGAIAAFGDVQDIDHEIVGHDAHFVLRVARPSSDRWEDRIVSLHPGEGFEPMALTRLRGAAALYNDQSPQRLAAFRAAHTPSYQQ